MKNLLCFLLVFFFQFTVHSLLWSQPPNDSCETATWIMDVQSDAAFVCLEGSNLGAQPEIVGNACSMEYFPTVWYKVITDFNAALINIQVTSDDFTAPTISLFRAQPDCSELILVQLTQSGLPCVVGSNGEAEAFASDVWANYLYYIAVSSLNSLGGSFEICVNTISESSACVVSRDIEITSRSNGGSLNGPFNPGETIGVCFNINSFTAANNGCQWFQGLVPVFGNGWDPSSFDNNGQPQNAKINGNVIGVPSNGVYNTSTWDWFTDVDYHYNHPFYQVGDLDSNGTVEMCNILYDPDCPDFGGLTAGCCGPCWGAPLGSILPPGWFAYGVNGTCPMPGPPIRVDWGDGPSCGGGHGPWSFCFDLIIRDYPECLGDSSTSDLSLGFFTLADGEIGSWTGNASVCALDQPAKLSLPLCCNLFNEDTITLNPICTGGFIEYIIDEPNVEFWSWAVQPGFVTGASGGSGGPGSIIQDTLINNRQEVQTVKYTITGFAGGACQAFLRTLIVEVSPELNAELDPIGFCSQPTNPYTIIPEITGGSGTYEYLWLPGGETTPTITITNPVAGSQYFLTVTDDSGCSDNTSTIITIGGSALPVDIFAPVTEQCVQDGAITLEADPNGGTPPYDFEWTLPDGTNISADSISTLQSGLFFVTVNDSEGCTGTDSVFLTFNEEPVVSIVASGGNVLCEGSSVNLNFSITGGEAPYSFTWNTPLGPTSSFTVVATVPGSYSVEVTDNNGCTATSTPVVITVVPLPVVDLGPDSIIVTGSTTLSLGFGFVEYLWSNGQISQSITVATPGVYVGCGTDQNGCMACDTIYVEIITHTIDLVNAGYLNIFPNPNNGLFMITGELVVDEEIGITVTNIIGQTVYASLPESVGTKISKEIDL